MAKKKKRKVEPLGTPSLISEMIDDSKKDPKLGATLYRASEHHDQQVGVPLPSLALEYLTSSSVLFLGRLYGISGPSESFKSTLALALGREVVRYGGGVGLVETEGGKISPATIRSMWGDQHAESCVLECVESLEAAQDMLTWFYKFITKKRPNRDAMFCLIVDSLTGAASDDRHAQIMKDGHGRRDYAYEAQFWTQWLRTFASRLAKWPIPLIYVNHEKQAMDGSNPNAKTKPGGVAQDFYALIYLSSTKIRSNETLDKVTTQVRIKVTKNSFGLPKRRVDLPVVVDLSGDRPIIDYDFGHATAHLLAGGDSRIKDICHVTTTSDSITAATRRFSCKQLGLSKVTGAELGHVVHEDSELMDRLRKAMHITKYRTFDGVMPDYGEAVVDSNRPEVDSDDADIAFAEDDVEI